MKGAYLGPSFENDDIERRLQAAGANYTAYGDAECWIGPWKRWWRAKRWAGSKGEWSSVRGPWATAPFWGMRDPARCSRC